MTLRSFVAFVIVLAFLRVGTTQVPEPSVAIGTHVFMVGMQEEMVLEQCRTDFELRRIADSSWLVVKKVGDRYQVVGSVAFKDHHLSSVSRNVSVAWDSSKSLFYALSAAIKSLEAQGFTDCKVTSNERDIPTDGGAVTFRSVNFRCGPKYVQVTLTNSDAPDTNSSLEIAEWIGHK